MNLKLNFAHEVQFMCHKKYNSACENVYIVSGGDL